MIMDKIIALKSAHNPTRRAYLLFLIPTLEKYNPNIYMVVSVLP